MDEQVNRKGLVIVLSGPSGVGKSTICREVLKRLNDIELSVSVTTRPIAKNEVDGQDYRFVSKEEFKRMLDNRMFLEHAEVFGNFYGTPKDRVDEVLAEGGKIILEIDVQGGQQVKRIYPEAVMIFILPPSQKHLVDRMNGRARDDDEVAKLRLDGAGNEIAAGWQYYKYIVVNDDLKQAVDEVIDIIKTSSGESK